MTSDAVALERRVAAWFERVVAHVSTTESQRVTVSGDAGPIIVTHTHQAGSSHARLADVLAGGVDPSEPSTTWGRITIHSLEAPPADVMLPSPVTDADLAGRVAVRSLAGTRWRLTWDGYAGVVRCFDRQTGTGVYITATAPEPWEYGAPFRAFLHWAAAARGAVMVHASTVVGERGAALVVGPGGTGKSTTALVGLDAGLATVGDDYIWLEPWADGFRTRSVYGTVKTKRDGRQPAVPLSESVPVADGDKTIHTLDDARRQRLARTADLAAVVLLESSDSTEPTASEALAATVPSTTLQLPYDESQALALLREVCRRTPIVRLRRDGDLDRLAADLSSLLGGPPLLDGRPSVLVAVPVYNGADHVERAIRSVLDQEGWHVHVVAVDDGSTDDSLAVLKRMAAEDPRLTVIANEGNKGVAAARNRAIAHRRDSLLALIDQDDYWTADHLTIEWSTLSADPLLGFVLGHQLFHALDGKVPGWVRDRWMDGPQTGFVFGTILAWRSSWEFVGPLDEELRAGSDDVDWFTRATRVGVKHRMIDDVVLHRLLHDRNASQRTAASTTELVGVLRRSLARGRETGS